VVDHAVMVLNKGSACTSSKTGGIMEDAGIGFETMPGVNSLMRYDNDMTQLEWLNHELDAFIGGMGEQPELLNEFLIDLAGFL
jgi:hypothetical protein